MMSPEWLTAIGTLGTFVVIAASAVAALMQLRHMRGSNAIVALTECREKLESEEFQNARHFIQTDMLNLLQQPDIRTQLEAGGPTPLELRQASYVANFFESLGTFVRFGIIDRNIACNLWCSVVARSWDALLPLIRIFRARDKAVWENFEYLTVISNQFMDDHPTTYPAGMDRMPMEKTADVS